jgi:hypothetical protein
MHLGALLEKALLFNFFFGEPFLASSVENDTSVHLKLSNAMYSIVMLRNLWLTVCLLGSKFEAGVKSVRDATHSCCLQLYQTRIITAKMVFVVELCIDICITFLYHRVYCTVDVDTHTAGR